MSDFHIDEFNLREGSWEGYIELLQYYYQANGIEDDAKNQAILMSVGMRQRDVYYSEESRHVQDNDGFNTR